MLNQASDILRHLSIWHNVYLHSRQSDDSAGGFLKSQISFYLSHAKLTSNLKKYIILERSVFHCSL